MASVRFDTGTGHTSHRLDPQGTTLGRLPSCDVVISDPSISRRHAAIWRHAGGWRIRDLNSRAGVKVDGRTITDAPLASDSIVHLGNLELSFDLGESTAVPKVERVSSGSGRDLVSSLSLSGSMLVRSLSSGTHEVSALGRIVRTAAAVRTASTAEAIASAVIEEARLATGAERGLLRLLHADRSELASYYSNAEAFTPSSTFIHRVLDEEAALIALDTAEDEELSVAQSVNLQGLGSLLCAPLWTGTRIAGVLYLDRRDGSFNPKAIELVLALGYLGAAELDRVVAAERLARERERRRTVARLLPQDIAEGLAAASGDFELEEVRVALAMAEVVGTGEPDAAEVQALVDTVLPLVVDECGGVVVDADPRHITILHRIGEDPAEAVCAAARSGAKLLEVSEALRGTRARWSGLRLKAAVHVGTAAIGLLGGEDDKRLRVLGKAWEDTMKALKLGRPGRIRVSSEAGPELVGQFDLVPEREGAAMALWLLPTRA